MNEIQKEARAGSIEPIGLQRSWTLLSVHISGLSADEENNR